MALQHLRSSTADKRPTPAAMSDGQLALNTNLASPGLFFKDSNGDSVKIGPVHVGTTAPNVTPGAGGQAGNSKGEAWLDTTAANPILKVWNGSAFVAVQPVGTGTVVSTADTGTVTSTMILDGTILNADVNASAAIAGTKISPDFGSQTIASTGVFSHALGAAATPSITFTGDLNTGFWSPSADAVAASTAGSERLRITSAGLVGIGTSAPGKPLTIKQPDGTSALRIEQGTGETYDIYRNGSDGVLHFDANQQQYCGYKFSTTPTGGSLTPRLIITSAGLVGIGTSAPGYPLDLQSESGGAGLRIRGGSGGSSVIQFTDNAISSQWGAITTAPTSCNIEHSAIVRFGTASTERVRIDSAGNVGIGITSPQQLLHVNSSGSNGGQLQITNASTGAASTDGLLVGYNTSNDVIFNNQEATLTKFFTSGLERAAIDPSGRLLVGTSSAPTGGTYAINSLISVKGYAGSSTGVGIFNISGGMAASSVVSGTEISVIACSDASGNEYATIKCVGDGTGASGNYPGRLMFSTNPGSPATGPTERMRINSSGEFLFGKTTNVASDNGAIIGGQYFSVASQGFQGTGFHRNGNDGGIVGFFQDGTEEGSISVSGTTVSYNGAHLSRWSQLPSGAERIEILRGTVLSNLDEMCEWGEEDNEQLNRMKVSDVEGDKNVSGVFQAWDDDDDTYTNDFYCAMTGDFIIRIAAGTTVERGDLLMSAGDGTAKPQADDLVRSCTVAKVTSANVSCTYDDGSYCVPCVLMAC
jgi:hypothetical protein